MEPAPYGGFMTRTVDQENEQKQKLDSQRVAVSYNGKPDTLRPEGIHVRGVDKLATNDIKSYVDYNINYVESNSSFEPMENQKQFRIQWVDDSNVNLIFKTHEDAVEAMKTLAQEPFDAETNSDENMEDISVYNGRADTEDIKEERILEKPALSSEYVNQLLVERLAKPYSSSLAFRMFVREQKESVSEELFQHKKLEKDALDHEKLEEEGTSVELYIRLSLRSDQKARNAAAYSRYYLLHGEPDRTRKSRRDRGNEHIGGFLRDKDEEGDLFLDKLATMRERQKKQEIDDDLFAERLRERSPRRRR